MSKNNTVKIGFFGIGLDTYWDQFDGLKDRLTSYLDVVADGIQNIGLQLVNL